jgi:hypothetical protein
MAIFKKEKEVKVCPERIENKVNYKIILLLICGNVGLYFIINSLEENLANGIVSEVSILFPLITCMSAFVMTGVNKMSKTFGRSCFILGIGYFLIFIGETIYTIEDLALNISPYPSIADIFFIFAYPCQIAYAIIHIRYFQPRIKKSAIIGISLLTLLLTSTYFFISSDELSNPSFELYYGSFFVILSAATLSITAYGASLFRGGFIATSWFVLLVGLIINTGADVWYYHLEALDQYDLKSPVNTLWFVGYWVVTYSLYKTKLNQE